MHRSLVSLSFLVVTGFLLFVATSQAELFQPTQTYTLFGCADASSVTIADLNHDGNPDLAVTCGLGGSNGQGLIIIMLGAGDGTFVLSSELSSGSGFATHVAVADMNRDGTPDLVVSNCGSTAEQGTCPNEQSNGVIAVLLGNGDGTFQTPVTYDAGGAGSLSVAVTDVNGDGLLDVIAANDCADEACTMAGGVGVLLGNGDGSLKTAVAYDGYGQGSIAVGDVDGDGKADLVLGGFQIGVLLGNGDGTFRFSGFYKTAVNSSSSPVLADLNQDGILDVVAVSPCATGSCRFGAVSVLFGNGDGSFQTAARYWSGGAGGSSIAVASLLADGHPDVIVSDCSTTVCGATAYGDVAIFRDRADGTLRRPVRFPSGGYDASFVAVGDVNGDGRPDLIVTNLFSQDLGVLLNASGEAP